MRLHARGVRATSDAAKQTIVAYLMEWLETIKLNLKRTTFREYERVVRRYLLPYFGSARLEQLTAAMIDHMHSTIKSPFNRRYAHTVLSAAIKQAWRRGIIEMNPCAMVDPPRVPKRPKRILTVAEIDRLLKACEGTRYHAIIVLAVQAGMRQGEIFGLQVSDWNRQLGVLHVQRALTEVDGVTLLEEPKSDSARRLITLPERSTKALESHLKFVEGGGESDGFLFTGERGKPLGKANFYRLFYKPLFAAANVPYCRFHDLRHTSASLLLQAGVHPKVVQERLGHSSISITMDLYSHAVPSLQREAADKMDNIFGG
ncbi:MAG: site-specific integrase [Planctomycetaceae bacterium]|nr:site-specific integrase [Planctomycetaceae bacterium]